MKYLIMRNYLMMRLVEYLMIPLFRYIKNIKTNSLKNDEELLFNNNEKIFLNKDDKNYDLITKKQHGNINKEIEESNILFYINSYIINNRNKDKMINKVN